MSLKKLVKFINGRWFPLVAVSSVFAFIVYVMVLCGWRFTYAPDLENNWEAVSGVSGWFGVAASFMAILYAVRVADKQNQITLFEKRYELFEIVFNSQIFANSIKNAKNNLNIQMMFFSAFCYNSIEDSSIPDSTVVSAKYIVIIQKLKQIPFLFKTLEESDGLQELIRALSDLMTSCLDSKKKSDFQEKIQKFSDYINSEDYKKLVDVMQKELNLK